jgi:iron complex outermembrane recepter protein
MIDIGPTDAAKAAVRGCFLASALIVGGAGSAFGDPAAPSTSPTDEGRTLEEVIVTATKHAETLSKAPIAMSALSGEQLQQAGISDVQGLNAALPDVQVQTTALENSIQVSIRGISSTDFGPYGESAVAVYIDGIPVSNANGLLGAFSDLDRVEVLRGPQGTLYGRNATAGSVNIITADPTNTLQASVEESAGNYGDIETRAMLNLPVSDTLDLRGSLLYHKNDGYINTEGSTVSNYDAADDVLGRVTALWRPTNMFKWRLSMEESDSNGTPDVGITTGANGQPQQGYSPFNRPVRSNPEPFLHFESQSVRSRMDWALSDTFSVAYIAGYQINKEYYRALWDADPTPIGYIIGAERRTGQSQELNINYNGKKLSNILGATYFVTDGLGNFNSPLDIINSTFISYNGASSIKSKGIFDQATYSVRDDLRLTAGVRYSHDAVEALNQTTILCPLNQLYFPGALPGFNQSIPANCSASFQPNSGQWSAPTWKIAGEYDLSSKTLSYLSVATGYKTGGVNTEPPGSPNATYNPEKVTNFELGLKSRYLEDHASTNVAIFLEQYRDLQVTQIEGVNLITTNAARAQVYGAELEGQWRVTSSDRLDGFFDYLHATYTDYNNAVDQQLNVTYPSLDGKYLPNAPLVSLQAHYAHEARLDNGGSITPSVTVYWQAQNYLRAFNLPIDHVPSYSRTAMSLLYKDSSSRWTAEAYVHNLENRYIRNNDIIALGTYISSYDPPRTFGVRVGYKY